MLNFWKKKKDESRASESASLTWSAEAQQGLQQALAQAPVPAMLKNRVKHELMRAAEDVARAAGHQEVGAQDLMQGLLARLPDTMRTKVEKAMKGGPEELKKLQKDLGNS